MSGSRVGLVAMAREHGLYRDSRRPGAGRARTEASGNFVVKRSVCDGKGCVILNLRLNPGQMTENANRRSL